MIRLNFFVARIVLLWSRSFFSSSMDGITCFVASSWLQSHYSSNSKMPWCIPFQGLCKRTAPCSSSVTAALKCPLRWRTGSREKRRNKCEFVCFELCLILCSKIQVWWHLLQISATALAELCFAMQFWWISSMKVCALKFLYTFLCCLSR